MVSNGLAKSDFTYDPATLAADTETISYDLNLDATPDFTRVLDRSQDTLARPTGWTLGTPTSPSALEHSATYSYSATDGRLQTVSDGTSAFTYGYLANSPLVETVTATAGAVHTVTNTWETTRDVLASKQNKVGSTVISQYDYTVNAIGQRTVVATSGTAFPATPAWAWGYDTLGQVISADSSVNTHDRAYQYDAIGNRLQGSAGVSPASVTTFTTNALNQYTAVGSVIPVHDDDGNMTSGPLPVAPATNSTLIWDAENRLIETQVGTSGPLVRHHYDAQSRRIATTVGTGSPSASTTLYLYDGWNVIAEWSADLQSASLTKTNLWGLDLSGTQQGAGGVGGLLLITDHSALITHHFPTYDGNGNISEYLTTTGAVAAHFEYDPFGNTVVNTDASGQFTYKFSTKPQDAETGLYYYGYRYYDPVTGRWPSRDPVGERGGINLYDFVNNDGTNKSDLLGMINNYGCCGGKPMKNARDRCCGSTIYGGGPNAPCCVNGKLNKRIPQWKKANYLTRGACMGDKTQTPESALAGGLIGQLAGGPVAWTALGGAFTDYWLNGRGFCDQLVCP